VPRNAQMRSLRFLRSWSSARVGVAGGGTEDATGRGGIKDDDDVGGGAAAGGGGGKYAGGGKPGGEDGRDIAFLSYKMFSVRRR